MTGRPGYGSKVAHDHVIEITTLQQRRQSAKQKSQRQVQFAACVVRSQLHLTLDMQSAGSVSLGCIVEMLTLYGLLPQSCGLCESQTRVLSWQPVHSVFPLYVFASLGFDFVNQCSLPLARLIGIAWFITFHVGV